MASISEIGKKEVNGVAPSAGKERQKSNRGLRLTLALSIGLVSGVGVYVSADNQQVFDDKVRTDEAGRDVSVAQNDVTAAIYDYEAVTRPDCNSWIASFDGSNNAAESAKAAYEILASTGYDVCGSEAEAASSIDAHFAVQAAKIALGEAESDYQDALLDEQTVDGGESAQAIAYGVVAGTIAATAGYVATRQR